MEKYYLCASDESNYEIVKSSDVPKTTYDGGKFWLRGIGYDSIEELKDHECVLEVPCLECSGVVSAKGKQENEIRERNLCKSCLFWTHILEDMDNERRLFVNGRAFFLRGKESAKYEHTKGFSGRKFRIKKDGGEIIETTDLWDNGQIPARFKQRLKDNAKFV